MYKFKSVHNFDIIYLAFKGGFMNTEFNILIKEAKARCNEDFVFVKDREGFSKIYPFATENINGYIDMFDLKNKSLLTLGSSGDQVINASLKDCVDQTVLDINPFTKYYFYLKKAALLTLEYDEYIKFFCYQDYPKVFKKNDDAFNIESYKKFNLLLKELDVESFIFWNNLFDNFKPIDIRKNLFNMDEDRISTLKESNLYLKNEDMYKKSKITIKNINPKFITGDIFNIELKDSYDSIFLSNLGTYHKIENFKLVLDKISLNLNKNGKMLLCYLYRTTKDTEYKEDWQEIYNLDKASKILCDYITNFESFIGVDGLKFRKPEIKDSVMIYRK